MDGSTKPQMQLSRFGVLFCLAWIVVEIAAITLAFGHSPEGADPAIAPWVRGLTQPGTNGASCCSETDCTLARGVKVVDGVYWVLDVDQGKMLLVDPGVILRNVNNQAGDYLACIHNGRVLCFVLAPGT